MLKQLFISATIATAFAASPVFAGDHDKMNSDDADAKSNTQNYDGMEREDNTVKPDKKAYDKSDDKNAEHPAHEMGEGSLEERGN